MLLEASRAVGAVAVVPTTMAAEGGDVAVAAKRDAARGACMYILGWVLYMLMSFSCVLLCIGALSQGGKSNGDHDTQQLSSQPHMG